MRYNNEIDFALSHAICFCRSTTNCYFSKASPIICYIPPSTNHAARANVDLNKYCSLFYLQNTKNQTLPLWKTLEVLEDWLKKEANDEEGMMTHGAIYRTLQSSMSLTTTLTSNNENFKPPTTPACSRFATASTSTPPRRANPPNAYQEHRIVSSTGATPKIWKKKCIHTVLWLFHNKLFVIYPRLAMGHSISGNSDGKESK